MTVASEIHSGTLAYEEPMPAMLLVELCSLDLLNFSNHKIVAAREDHIIPHSVNEAQYV